MNQPIYFEILNDQELAELREYMLICYEFDIEQTRPIPETYNEIVERLGVLRTIQKASTVGQIVEAANVETKKLLKRLKQLNDKSCALKTPVFYIAPTCEELSERTLK